MRLLLLAAVVLLCAAPAAAATVTATLTTSTRAPVVGEAWRYTVSVRSDGRPAAARVRLQVLAGRKLVGCSKDSRIVACGGGATGDWISFRGSRTGFVRWRGDSVGERLTFEALVRAGGTTLRLRAPVVVRPTS